MWKLSLETGGFITCLFFCLNNTNTNLCIPILGLGFSYGTMCLPATPPSSIYILHHHHHYHFNTVSYIYIQLTKRSISSSWNVCHNPTHTHIYIECMSSSVNIQNQYGWNPNYYLPVNMFSEVWITGTRNIWICHHLQHQHGNIHREES